MNGLAAADNHLDATRQDLSLGLLDALQHEGCLSQCQFRAEFWNNEGYQQTSTKLIRFANGVFKCVIALRPLALLHPVQNVVAAAFCRMVQVSDAFGLNELGGHRGSIGFCSGH